MYLLQMVTMYGWITSKKDENGCVYLGGTDECVDGVIAWMPIRKYEL